MPMNRREFLLVSASLAGAPGPPAAADAPESDQPGPGSPSKLLNYNADTAIGLGDEPAGILDPFGQLRGRNVHVLLDLNSPLKPFQNEERVPGEEWQQWLASGHLPIVRTRTGGRVSVDWTAFASAHAGVKGEYIVVNDTPAALRLRLLFPYVTAVRMEGDQVIGGDKVLASLPRGGRVTMHEAKYNLLSPDSWWIDVPRWDSRTPLRNRPGLAKAFNSGREVYLNRSIEYRIPVARSRAYYAYLGLITDQKQARGQSIFRLSVNGETQLVDVGDLEPGIPLLLEFAVASGTDEIRVASECDPSAMSMYRHCFLNAVWLFDVAVDRERLKTGALDASALAHIPCGREPLTDAAASVDLDYEPAAIAGKSFFFPYDLPVREGARAAGISSSQAEQTAAAQWTRLLEQGADLRVGVPRLDNLYRTCVVNLFLLRTRYPGAARDGQDLYVVKPGATIYNNFWTRDGAYIVTAMGLAGQGAEAEKSLRLFWQDGLKGMFATWGQQPGGFWQSPITQWDSNGQALWALVRHFELTRDRRWLAAAYPSIRKGAMWIKSACEQMQFTNENGEKPTYYGLLPPGEGESIASGINYYHNYWAVLGLRQAEVAAAAPGESADGDVFRSAGERLRSNLLASVRTAFARTGGNRYIPATPFDPQAGIWGSANALYPCRFLEAHDPMMTATLATLDSQVEEGSYIYRKGHLWNYIGAEMAMCHLLRDELDSFYKLFNGFVAHSSPTNAWVEGILLDERRGTGDMPHGWAAAEYIFLHRNSLVYENDGVLELCWGVQPDWLPDGARLAARRAPTTLGVVDLEVRRAGAELQVRYGLTAGAWPAPGGVRLHLPRLEKPLSAVVVNSKHIPLAPGQSVVGIG